MTALLGASHPAAPLDLPVLRDLSASSRDALFAAGRVFEVAPGDVVFRTGDPSESFFVVVTGAVSLRLVRRGDVEPSVLRIARRGETFGEEASLPGVGRRSTASADAAGQLLEIPLSVYRRIAGRDSSELDSGREQRYLRRAAVRDLLWASVLARDLPEEDLELLVDAANLVRRFRTEPVFELGDHADSVFVVVDGLIQIQTGQGDDISVRAYVSRGDFFGDQDALTGTERSTAAVAIGDTVCARIPAVALRTVSDRHPGLLRRLRRVDQSRRAAQGEIIGEASARATQHVFHDLYRMQIARSLLVIDQDSCVRCGHCAWSCAQVHGVSRLIRRGDKVVARLRGDQSARGPSSLLLPNTCQHCRNAACMIDCPTGAIARDLNGEVFIREDLCTGCGNCAKGCPWQNIQMAPRSSSGPELSSDVAVKCDLCRGYESPACVQACPTESLLRLDPARDIAEVSQLLGRVAPVAMEPSAGSPRSSNSAAAPRLRTDGLLWIGASAAAAIAIAGLGIARHLAAVGAPGTGVGLAAGVIAGAMMLCLAGYTVPKRMVRLWMKRRAKGIRGAAPGKPPEPPGAAPLPRSRTRPHFIAHVSIGLVAAGCVLVHSGLRLPGTEAGALVAAFWLSAVMGGLGGLAYWLIPSRLARLERRGSLPEDIAGQRNELFDRLYRESTGTSDLVKTITARILVPYARSVFGPIALVASGHSLRDEQARVRARVDSILSGRGAERLTGLDDLIKTVVEVRALAARRWMSRLLRSWLPVHIAVSGVALGMLALHVGVEVLR